MLFRLAKRDTFKAVYTQHMHTWMGGLKKTPTIS